MTRVIRGGLWSRVRDGLALPVRFKVILCSSGKVDAVESGKRRDSSREKDGSGPGGALAVFGPSTNPVGNVSNT